MIWGMAMPMVTPEQAADAGEHDRLDQELLGDVAPLGAQGAADADLAGPLGHGRQHDVHDADAADQQRDGGDRAQDDAELPGRLLGGEQQVVGDGHLDVLLGVAGLVGGLDDRDRRADLVDRRRPGA